MPNRTGPNNVAERLGSTARGVARSFPTAEAHLRYALNVANRTADDSTAAVFPCDAALYDGTNDSVSRGSVSGGPRDWTNSADSKVGIISFWFLMTAGSDGEEMWPYDSGTSGTGTANRVYVQRQTGNAFFVVGKNASGSSILEMNSSAYAVDGNWHHFIASWNLAGTEGWLYVDGVEDQQDGSPTFTDDDMDHTVAEHWIGGPAGHAMNMAMAEYYFNIDTYLDLSVAANVLKFRSTAGKPVDLGADGSTPSGVIPTGYFHLDDGETANNFATNAGDGGGCTVAGALTTESSCPSD